MMLINAKLPISSDRLNQQDQTLRLAGIDWADYNSYFLMIIQATVHLFSMG